MWQILHKDYYIVVDNNLEFWWKITAGLNELKDIEHSIATDITVVTVNIGIP